MKKILITGGTGFIGSHLSEYMVRKGYKVIVYDKYNINNSWGWLENSKLKNEIEVILGDIRDYDQLNKISKGVDSLIHLAALIGIPYSYVSPIAYIRTNLEGTYNVLEVSKNNSINNTIITSTSENYGSAQYVPIDEKHPLVAQSPYSASKISADNLAISYYLSYNLPIKIIRPFNCFGPRQSARAIIPTIISQLINKGPLKLGNINIVRDFTYVSDLVNAYYAILKSKKFYGEITNVGTGKGYNIKQIIEKISNNLQIYKKISIEKKRVRPNKSEVTKLICDNSKLIKNSNWKIKTSFDDGLQKTIKFIIENKDYLKSDIYNV